MRRRPVVFKVWDVDAEFEEEEEEEEEDEGEEGDTTAKRAEGDEGKFGDPDIDPLKESIVPKHRGPDLDFVVTAGQAPRGSVSGPSPSFVVSPAFGLTPPFVEAARQRARLAVQDRYTPNRYGQVRILYSPPTARVNVVQIKYRERMDAFITRFVRGGADSRVTLAERELSKFRRLTDTLAENVIVKSMQVKNLALTSRTNPRDAKDPTRLKACTDDPEDYCTFVYRVTISHPGYHPRTVLLTSEYALGAPGVKAEGVTSVMFKSTGPTIYEAAWPGVDLKPTPALFLEAYVRVLTDRIKCQLGPQDYQRMNLTDFSSLWALPERDRWQRLYDNGLLSHGPPRSMAWPLSAWRAQIATARSEAPDLWLSAQERIKACACKNDAEGRRIRCWRTP